MLYLKILGDQMVAFCGITIDYELFRLLPARRLLVIRFAFTSIAVTAELEGNSLVFSGVGIELE